MLCHFMASDGVTPRLQGAERSENNPSGGHSAAPHPDAHTELLLSSLVWRYRPRERKGESPVEDTGGQSQAGLS